MLSIWITSRIELGQVDGPSYSCMRVGRESRRSGARPPTEHPASRRRRNVSLRQSYCTPELARRHVDQHQVHRPRAEPVLVYSLLQLSSGSSLPVEPAYPRPLDYDLASVETDLALRAPPAMTAPILAARMPWPTCLTSASASIIAPSVSIPAARRNRSNDADISSHALPTGALGIALVIMVDVFMALFFLSWIQHPEPNGSRRATPLLLVQHRPGHSPRWPTDGQALRIILVFLPLAWAFVSICDAGIGLRTEFQTSPRTSQAHDHGQSKVKIGLALSGGGYRAALFHAGVMSALERSRIPIEVIGFRFGRFDICGLLCTRRYAPAISRRGYSRLVPSSGDICCGSTIPFVSWPRTE